MAPVIRFELMSTVLETVMLPLHQTGYKSIVGDIILAVTMRLICFAERQGFEPQNLLQLPVFKTGAFNHSAIFPFNLAPSLGRVPPEGYFRLSVHGLGFCLW